MESTIPDFDKFRIHNVTSKSENYLQKEPDNCMCPRSWILLSGIIVFPITMHKYTLRTHELVYES